MHFKEYIEYNKDVELFDKIFELDENILAPAKFVGGAATNLASQALRGAGNIAGGLSRTALGGARVGAGALQALGGGLKPGWENISKGASTAASGLGQAATGAAQTVASPVSAALRGAQAASEPLSPKEFSKDRNWLQKTFGLNRWGKEESEKKPVSSKPNNAEWLSLVQAYRTTEDRNERVKILAKLKQLDPVRYSQTVRAKTPDEKTKSFLAGLERKHKGVG